jgi:integrase
MTLFGLNTGCKQEEICGLRWEWEVPITEMSTSVFLIPSERVKNREEKLLVINRIARTVIEGQRGEDPEYVFTYLGHRLSRMNNEGWRNARYKAGLPNLRVHDLRHTFARRLRAAGVSYEDRQDLLGHKSKRITMHYSKPELENLIISANKICGGKKSRKNPALVVLKCGKVS